MREYNTIKIIVFVVSMFLFSSCGNRTPIIGSSDQLFVVGSMEVYRWDDSMTIYYGKGYDNGFNQGLWMETTPSIVLPNGMFQINDTIRLVKPNKKSNFVKK